MGQLRRPVSSLARSAAVASSSQLARPGLCRSRLAVVFAAVGTVLMVLGVSQSFAEDSSGDLTALHVEPTALPVVSSPPTQSSSLLRKAPEALIPRESDPPTLPPSVNQSSPESLVYGSRAVRERPVNAIILAAAGVDPPDLFRTLASIAESVPEALVVLVVSHAEAEAVMPRVTRRDPAHGGQRSGQIALNLLMYSWAALDALQPPDVRARLAPTERYSLYTWILDDLRR